MKKKNGSELNLEIADGETVTIKIVSSFQIKNLVNFSLNSKGKPLPKTTAFEFKLDKQAANPQAIDFTFISPPPDGTFSANGANPSDLGITFHFAGSKDGSFTVEVTGDRGGDVSVFPYEQEPKEDERIIIYTFYV